MPMAITLNDDYEIFNGPSRVMFPRDGNHSPSAFLTGFDTNDDIVFGRFTPDGRLKVDASVTIDTVDIGDVNTLLKVGGVNRYLGGVLAPDAIHYAALVDPIDRVAREAGRVLASDAVFATESKVTTDVLANMRTADMNVRRYVSKHVVVKNVGATNARVNMLASVDDGANFDIILAGNVVLAPGAVLGVDETRAATHIRVEARSNAAGSPTTIETRAYAMGV